METKFIPTNPEQLLEDYHKTDDMTPIIEEWKKVTGIDLRVGHTYDLAVDVYEEYTADGYSVYVLDIGGEGMSSVCEDVYCYQPDNYVIYEAIEEYGRWDDNVRISNDLFDEYDLFPCFIDRLETNYNNYLTDLNDNQ